ncbi:MAG: c(7)-type cytochrome triheme domain-containing protein [Nitrospirota bacterium]
MKIIVSSIIAALTIAALANIATAVPPGKVLEWKTPMGTVIFNGKIHQEKGLVCDNCHPKIFQQKRGSSDFKMTDIKMRRFCGECHNGTKAFNANEGNNCIRCHKR